MVDPLLFAITNVNLALRTVDGSRKLFDANNVENRDPGRVYDTVKKHMAARSHLSPSDGYRALINPDHPGRKLLKTPRLFELFKICSSIQFGELL